MDSSMVATPSATQDSRVSHGQRRRRSWTRGTCISSSPSALPLLLLSLALLLVLDSTHAFFFHSFYSSPSSPRRSRSSSSSVLPSSFSSSPLIAMRLFARQKNESSSSSSSSSASSAAAVEVTSRLRNVTPLQAQGSAVQDVPQDTEIGGLTSSAEEDPAMLGTQTAAAAASAPSVEDNDPSMNPLPPAATKKRGGGRGKRASAYAEQDWSVKTKDDVCRATINVISSGDEKDLQMLTPFVERLLTRYGDHVEILHRSYVPDDKPGLRLLEIWFEGFETFRLYSRYQFTKKGKQGDLTAESIEEMCTKIDYAMYLDATGDYGPL